MADLADFREESSYNMGQKNTKNYTQKVRCRFTLKRSDRFGL